MSSTINQTKEYLKLDKIEDKAQEDVLAHLIDEHNKLYEEGSPIISDSDFDKLYFLMKNYNENNKSINSIFSLENTFKKYEHIHPILSLAKAKTVEDLNKFFDKWKDNKKPYQTDSFLIEHKEDGLTVVFYYGYSQFNNGKFTAVTRGGGKIGEDITPSFLNIDKFKNEIIPNLEKANIQIAIRGEAIINDENFEKINDENDGKFMNARNLVAGSIRTKDAKIANKRHVEFLAYNIENIFDNDFQNSFDNFELTEKWQLNYLQSLGFTTTYSNQNDEIVLYENNEKGINKLISYIENFTTEKRDLINHDIDGLVIKPNNLATYIDIRHTDHHPESQIAYKFKSKGELTKLIDVEWQIGTKGQVTPVGIFEPINLFGATISKASLASFDNIQRRDIKIGDTIYVQRSNDVIPQIVKSLPEYRTGEEKDIEIPENTHFEGLLLFTNEVSDTQKINQWGNLISREVFNIDALGKESIVKLIENNLLDIDDLSSLYRIDKNKFLEIDGFGAKRWDKLQEELEKAKTNVTLPQMIQALNIRLLGRRFSEQFVKLFKDFNDFEDMYLHHKEKIADKFANSEYSKGFGKTIENQINKELIDETNLNQITRLRKLGFVFPIPEEKQTRGGKLSNLHFVLTGKMSISRKEYEKQIIEHGGIIDGGIKKTTNYLVTNDLNSNSSKMKKAKEFGTQLIDENKLKELMGD